MHALSHQPLSHSPLHFHLASRWALDIGTASSTMGSSDYTNNMLVLKKEEAMTWDSLFDPALKVAACKVGIEAFNTPQVCMARSSTNMLAEQFGRAQKIIDYKLRTLEEVVVSLDPEGAKYGEQSTEPTSYLANCAVETGMGSLLNSKFLAATLNFDMVNGQHFSGSTFQAADGQHFSGSEEEEEEEEVTELTLDDFRACARQMSNPFITIDSMPSVSTCAGKPHFDALDDDGTLGNLIVGTLAAEPDLIIGGQTCEQVEPLQ